MGIVVLLVMVVSDLMLMGLTFWRGREKSRWILDRFAIRGIQMGLYWVLLLFPGAAFDFRFKLLFVVLLIQLFLIELILFAFGYRVRAIRQAPVEETVGFGLSVLIIFLLVNVIEWWLNVKDARKLTALLRDYQEKEQK